ncbi:MAG: hypothetical protein KDC34_16655 [Saprospiraceae bacterium]|nr:hypothetical protein [Saprospiraceae bacterium]
MLRFTAMLTVSLLFAGVLVAQPNPSNLYLFDLAKENDQSYALTKPTFLTPVNPGGYNNQPQFASSELLLFSSGAISDSFQTDIYALNLAQNTITKITETAESEYSPTLMPDYFYFSAVRVEADPDQTQRLWQFPLDRLNNGKPVFPNIRNIGYHYWISRYKVLLYIVNSPNLLIIADTRDGSWEKVSSDVGRCFKRLPDGRVAFIQKESEDLWMLCALNTQDFTATGIVPVLAGVEDFVVLNDGSFLMGRGSRMYHFNPKAPEKGWVEIADLRDYGINAITRISTNGNGRLVLVSE